MSGTREGGRKAAAKNLAADPDFYRKIGAIGGKVTSPDKGFGGMPREKAQRAQALAAKSRKANNRRSA